mmetsp:Transcript_42223/g.99123  ORF Transcript_42223/g.99123 Transcript_42223/m.99123 type:complete len:802 (-) Transcript_42223:92-2497(-)
MSFAWCVCCQTDNTVTVQEHVRFNPGLAETALDQHVLKASLACALWEAAESGNANDVQNLLFAGVEVNAGDDSTPRIRGRTALILAAQAGHVAVVETLLEAPDIDVNTVAVSESDASRNGCTALHSAAQEGHSRVVAHLLTHPTVDVNRKTQVGFTALHLAARYGHSATVKILARDSRTNLRCGVMPNSKVELDALQLALYEGYHEVVEVLVNTGRADGPDLTQKFASPYGRATPLNIAAMAGHASVVHVLLQAKADPSIENEKGRTTLEIALDADSTEVVMHLLSSGTPTSRSFTAFRHTQILGDAKKLQGLCKQGDVMMKGEEIPALHRAVLLNNMQDLSLALTALPGDEAAHLHDGVGFPAVYWAVELAHWTQVQALLCSAHGMSSSFVDKLLSGVYGPISTLPSEEPGQRLSELFHTLLSEDAASVAEKKWAKGAASLLQPFCASVTALKYFEANKEDFKRLQQSCTRHSSVFLDRIDKEVGASSLKWLAQVAREESQNIIRQDTTGLVPELMYLVDESRYEEAEGNPELFVARSLALAGIAVSDIFHEDVRDMIKNVPSATLMATPPKTFYRMYTKLLNRFEHGDPTIPKPRPMRNVDIVRCCISVAEPEDVERVYRAIKAKCKVLRAKNTYNPDSKGHCAVRSLTLNIAYESRIPLKKLFGLAPRYRPGLGTGDSQPLEGHVAGDVTSKRWRDYCASLHPASDWLWGLQGWFYVTRQDPDRYFAVAGEIQIVLAPYCKNKSFLDLLYKLSLCDGGPSDLAREFGKSLQVATDDFREKEAAAKNHAALVRANHEKL